MGFINHDDVGLFFHLLEDGGEIRAVRAHPALEIGVIKDFEREETVQQMRHVAFDVALPDRLAAGLRHEQDDAFLLIHHEPLDEHQTDEGFAQADTVAKECTAVVGSDVVERCVAVALILVEDGMDF